MKITHLPLPIGENVLRATLIRTFRQRIVKSTSSGYVYSRNIIGLQSVSWFYWSLPATMFFYGFFQRVAPSVLVDDMMREFDVSGATVGSISAFYYYAYATIQVPAGLLIDRYGAQRTLASAAAICAIGSLLFSYSENNIDLYISRLLIGLGVGFSFVGALKIAHVWFPSHQFAFLSGLTLSLGMVGGVCGQAPLASLIPLFGWRLTMGLSSIFALTILIFIIFFMKESDRSNARNLSSHEVGRNFLAVLCTKQIWVIAISGGGMAAVITAFTGLWAVPFIIESKEITKADAAGLASLVLLGSAVGAPLAGWASDYFKNHKLVIIVGSCLVLFILLTVIYVEVTVFWGFYILLFSLGVTVGSVIVIYSAARQYSPRGAEGTTIAFINMFVMSSGALFQPLIGWLLDLNWDGTLSEGARIYSVEAYYIAFSTLVAVNVAALLFAAAIHEKRVLPVK